MSVLDRLFVQSMLTDRLYAAEREYWSKQLQGELYFGRFPTSGYEHPAEAVQRTVYRLVLTPERAAELNQLCGGSRTGMYMVCASAVTFLLYKYSSNEDVTFGMPLFVRQPGDSANHMLAVRSDVSGDMTFRALLTQMKDRIVEADRHQSLPFEAIAAMKELLWGQSRYFHTVVTMDKLHMPIPEHEKFDMHLHFEAESDKLALTIEYNSALYGAEEVERLGVQVELFLEQVLAVPDRSLHSITLVTEEEKRQMLEWSRHPSGYPEQQTIHGLFQQQVAERPGHPAVKFGQEQLTYEELDRRSTLLAARLRELGVKQGGMVAVILERSVDMPVCSLAVLKAGGAYVPIDPDFPEDRRAFMLADSGAPIVLTQRRLVSSLSRDSGVRIIEVDDPALYEEGSDSVASVNDPADLAYVIYTSGTTGKPKGVMIEHRQVVRLLFNDRFQFQFGGEDRWTMFHSYCFDVSVWEMYGALLKGGTLIIVSKETAQDPAAFRTLIRDEKVTVLCQTPSAFYPLADGETALESAELCVKWVIFAGEALKPSKLKSWKTKYPDTQLINMYGITETTVHSTFKRITDAEIATNNGNIGRPLPTLNMYILDSQLHVLPVGMVGEICVGGAGVARGYLNLPELTAQRFIQSPHDPEERLYRSGDLARYMPSGEMEYIGRMDHQVKIRGFRIELGEIETVLLQHSSVNDVVVLAKEEEQQKYIVAYFVADQPLGLVELRTFVLASLPDYMVPAYFVQVDAIPLTSNGKADRRALPDPKLSMTGDVYEAPRNETEQMLVTLWEEVTGTQPIGIHHNFFHSGGDSIKAVSLISKVNDRFGIELQVKQLYLHQTVNELAPLVDTTRAAGEGSSSSGGSGMSRQAKVVLAIQEIGDMQRRIMKDPKLASLLPDDVEQLYPMSDIQRGMVYHGLLNPGEAYHNQHLYPFTDQSFQFELFRKAITMLADKHSIFRTTFNMRDFETPMQIVRKSASVELSFESLQHLEREEQTAHLEHVLAEDMEKPFDISTGPLWRMKLFQLEPDAFCLVWIFHHAIIDGWSKAAFITELSNTYFRLKEHPEHQAAPLRNGYLAYVAEQQVIKQDAEIQQFWRQELDQYKRLQFPVRYPQQDSGESYGDYLLPLGEELLMKLKAAGKQLRTEVKTLCFAAYACMLNMLSYENDLTVGIVEHNRPVCEDSEQMLGCFLNTVPVRLKLEREWSFSDYASYVQRKLIELKEYGRLPLYEIMKAAGEQAQEGNPIFDTLFNYVDFHIFSQIESTDGGSGHSPLPVHGRERTNTYFDFSITNTFQQFEAYVIYDTARFRQEDVERLTGYFVRALQAIAEFPHEQLRKDRILSEDEKTTLLYEFNDTQRPYRGDASFPVLFMEMAASQPERMAVHYNGKSLTYRELNEQSNRLARRLRGMGIGNGQIVAIMCSHCLETVLGALAVLKTGAAYVPVDPEYPRERIEHMTEDSGAQLILAVADQWPSDFEESFSIRNIRTLQLSDPVDDDAKWSAEAPDWPMPDVSDLAYIIYTSGSTGKPKGVMVEHRGIANLQVLFADTLAITAADRAVQFASSSFDASLWEMAMALLTGAALYIPDKETILNAARFEQYLNQHAITAATLPPTYLQHLDPDRIHTLRTLITAGSAIPAPLLERWKQRVCYYNAYGPTESTICTTVWSPSMSDTPSYSEANYSVPIGKPIANARLYVLDQLDQLQPIGTEGELCIAGDLLARGYLNREELTELKFTAIPAALREPGGSENRDDGTGLMYRTGDLVKWLPDGNLAYIGRMDYQVKIRGYRIEIGEIEQLLLDMEEIREAIVIDREDEHGSRYLCAYYVATGSIAVAEMRRRAAAKLPGYMIPSHFIPMDELPLTPNGKIDRQALPLPAQQPKDGKTLVEPRNELEQTMALIWQDVLGQPSVSMDDHFFELGGDSIKAIQVTARLQQAGFELEVKELLQASTIAEASEAMREVRRQIDQGPVEGEFPLTPIQRWLFEENGEAAHHFNQSIMLYKPEGFETDVLRTALVRIVEHHDVLRAKFAPDDEQQMTGYIRGIGAKDRVQLDCYGLYDLKEQAEIESTIEEIADVLQSSMDLAQGPLLKAAVFHTSYGDHLLLAVHHLVMDGVSWRIVLEDLFHAYGQLSEGRSVRLPAKTDSFIAWSEKLQQYASSKELLRELDYWTRLDKLATAPLPGRRSASSDQMRDSASVSVTLSREETAQFIGPAHHAFNTEANDLLLTALGRTIHQWSGIENVSVQLEGHGREPLFKDCTVSRTVGWFTTAYPVVLSMSMPNGDERDGLSHQIKSVKEDLRKTPNKGIGYGILKHMTPKAMTESVDWSRRPEINFNYLGQFDAGSEDAGILSSPYGGGSGISPAFRRPAVWDVTCIVNDGIFTASIHYNSGEYEAETMERLAAIFQRELQRVIGLCMSKDVTELTPTDVGNSELTLDELADISDFFNNL